MSSSSHYDSPLISSRRHRGSVYLLLLSVSMLVTIIGLSSMYVLRIDRRSTNLQSAALEAGYNATSLLGVAVLRINNDPDWRHTYTNDIWEPNETIDNMIFTFKLVDS